MTVQHLNQIAQRIANAEQYLIDALKSAGQISDGEALRVAAYYKKHRLVKLDLTNQRYTVKHGGFWDRDVIRRAVEQSIIER